MRFFTLIIVLLLIDLYAFQAVRLLSQHWSASLRILTFSIFWLVPILTIAYLMAADAGYIDNWSKGLQTFARTFVFIIYISKLLILPFLLIDDLRRAGQYVVGLFQSDRNFDYSRSNFLSGMGILLGALPFISLTYGIIRNPYRYRLFREKVPIANLPKALQGLKIIQISDIHSGSFTFKDPVRNAINLINEQKPDLVFFTGDLVNDQASEMDNFMDVFNGIQATYGVYSVLGNHDYGDYHRWPSAEAKVANLERLKAIHGELGWQLLMNENRLIKVEDTEVAVIGVENYSAHPRFPKHGDLAKAYQGTDNAAVKLLLSHDPSHWEDQVTTTYQDINLTFSGHTHGMQFGIEIPGVFKWSPIKYVYRQWAGLYRKDQQYLYVNRGLGFLGYPGRVGILPEITSIELIPA